MPTYFCDGLREVAIVNVSRVWNFTASNRSSAARGRACAFSPNLP
jgi:hypothetical protein